MASGNIAAPLYEVLARFSHETPSVVDRHRAASTPLLTRPAMYTVDVPGFMVTGPGLAGVENCWQFVPGQVIPYCPTVSAFETRYVPDRSEVVSHSRPGVVESATRNPVVVVSP